MSLTLKEASIKIPGIISNPKPHDTDFNPSDYFGKGPRAKSKVHKYFDFIDEVFRKNNYNKGDLLVKEDREFHDKNDAVIKKAVMETYADRRDKGVTAGANLINLEINGNPDKSIEKDPRWNNVIIPFSGEEVMKLRGTHVPRNVKGRIAAEKLYKELMATWEYDPKNPEKGYGPRAVRSLSAMNGSQATQIARAGLKAIYISGWQIAADANQDGETYTDQSRYSVSSGPALVNRLNKALETQDKIQANQISQAMEKAKIKALEKGIEIRNNVDGKFTEDFQKILAKELKDMGINKVVDYDLPLILDIEAGFGGIPNVYDLTGKAIEAGAAAVHLEDQLSSAKKCGHMAGKVLVPSQEHIKKLIAVRLSSMVNDARPLIIARTDANAAKYITGSVDISNMSDIDRDSLRVEVYEEGDPKSFQDGLIREQKRDDQGQPMTKDVGGSQEPVYVYKKYFRNSGGMLELKNPDQIVDYKIGDKTYKIRQGLKNAIDRGLAYAPYTDIVWCETSTPSYAESKIYADAIHAKFPDKMLSYNCSPSFPWAKKFVMDELLVEMLKAEGLDGQALDDKFEALKLAEFDKFEHDALNKKVVKLRAEADQLLAADAQSADGLAKNAEADKLEADAKNTYHAKVEAAYAGIVGDKGKSGSRYEQLLGDGNDGKGRNKMKDFQRQLAEKGYKYQFITLSGFHQINHAAFEGAYEFARRGTEAYSTDLQEPEGANQEKGCNSVKHQDYVGASLVGAVDGTVDPEANIRPDGEESTEKHFD